MMKNFIICCTLLMTLITPSYGFLGNTHEEIAKSAVNERKILLNNEINKIGLDFGIEELFRDGDVNFIIRSGAITEDNGIRFRNHFYNPLDGSGLADVATGSSSYEWADQINSGWSWRNSRLSFYRGMTATSDVERRSALADSFRALGQVMHLAQDTAVPAHVRNDLHMIPDGFEAYASENVNPLNFVPIAFSGPKNSISTYSPRQLWDSDQYDGTNPKTSAAIGLAEYTNANFASEDTIFTENYLDDWNQLNNEHYFPYPRQADMVVVDESQNRIGMNGYVIYRKYFEKIGGGQIIRHFATASRLYEHLLDDPEPSIQGFDDHCYKDYADLLIPRAVGYSAALLDYFFRGQIDMTTDSDKYVIKNESDEAISGTFRLYYDDKYDMRKLVPAAEWNLNITAKGKSSPVTFTAPCDAKEPGKYMLVFLGTHGAESGAVAGKIVELSPESPPYIFLYTQRVGYQDLNSFSVGWSTYAGVLWDYEKDVEVPVYDQNGNRVESPYFLGNPGWDYINNKYRSGGRKRLPEGIAYMLGIDKWHWTRGSYDFNYSGSCQGQGPGPCQYLPPSCTSDNESYFQIDGSCDDYQLSYATFTGAWLPNDRSVTYKGILHVSEAKSDDGREYSSYYTGKFLSHTFPEQDGTGWDQMKWSDEKNRYVGCPSKEIRQYSTNGTLRASFDRGRAFLGEHVSYFDEISYNNDCKWVGDEVYSKYSMNIIAVQYNRPLISQDAGEAGFDYSDNAWRVLNPDAIKEAIEDEQYTWDSKSSAWMDWIFPAK